VTGSFVLKPIYLGVKGTDSAQKSSVCQR
jgi:hypothetical protein